MRTSTGAAQPWAVGASSRWRDSRDRFVASDPGLSRLRHGIRAVVALATTVILQAAIAAAFRVPHQGAVLHEMIGAIVALNLATTLRENRRRVILGTAVLAAAAAMLGASSAVLAAPWHWLALVVFVALTFAAVWMRRFGPRWFTVGFVMWQAHFFGLFLHPPVSVLPGMLLAAAISTIWVGLLLLTVLHVDPESTLRRTVTALRAQARSVIRSCIEVLADPDDADARREVRAQLIKTNEVALLFDGQLADSRALPEGVSPLRLRQWIIDVEIGVDEVAGAVLDLVGPATQGGRGEEARHTDEAVSRALTELGWARFEQARVALAGLRRETYWHQRPVRRLVTGAELLLSSIEGWIRGDVLEQARTHEEGYEPVVALQGGNLPGSQRLAGQTAAEARHWYSPGRLRFTTRQAIQSSSAVALALLVGELISPQRAYWAAIAAFVTFTGASTTSETTRKAVDRTVGTVLGLLASLALAQVVGGHPVLSGAIMLAGLFLAFYVQALSTTWMIFFLTLVLGQLYEVLRTFNDNVLVLRLAETAVGGASGILVTFLLLPASARDTLIRARRALLSQLAGLLDLAGRILAADPSDRVDNAAVYRDLVALDESARQLAAGHDSLIRPRLFDADHAARRHRVAVLGVCAASGRSLLQAVLVAPNGVPAAAAAVCRLLAAEARRLAAVPDLKDQRPAAADRPGISAQVSDLLAQADGIPIVIARREQRLADALALLTPQRR